MIVKYLEKEMLYFANACFEYFQHVRVLWLVGRILLHRCILLSFSYIHIFFQTVGCGRFKSYHLQGQSDSCERGATLTHGGGYGFDMEM